ncbi:MAG: hypothetical protein HC854_02770 [Flavobacterium sp.]|nr:hypothetical protein [Flavobacterium sp.]
MKKYLFILILITSCSTKIDRPEIKGYVFDVESKKPIQNVKVNIDKNIVFTNENGEFHFKLIKKRKFLDFESGHDPKIYSIIMEEKNYVSDTIEEGTRGEFSDEIKVYDSIFLIKI